MEKAKLKGRKKEKERVVGMLASHNPSGPCIMPRPESQGSIQPWGPEYVEFKASICGMWRTGLRGSIYEVQRECLSWWMMDRKLIIPPPPVSNNEQKLWRGAHDKNHGPSAQCTTHTQHRVHDMDCMLCACTNLIQKMQVKYSLEMNNLQIFTGQYKQPCL